MSQDNPGGLHDATNSWNGYNHQGKIALYYAVDEIVKMLKAAPSLEASKVEFAKTFLEIEWAEDFSIGELTPDGEKSYRSVHQVKDRQDDKLERYKSAIQGLAVNLARHPEAQKAYLHVTRELDVDPGEPPFRDEVEKYVKDLQWIDTQIIDGEKDVAKQLKAYHDMPDTRKKTKAKAKVALEEAQQELEQTKELKKKLLSLADDSDRMEDIKVFQYTIDGQPMYWCGKPMAKELVKRSLKNFYRVHDPAVEKKQLDSYIKKSYQYLLEKLNAYVAYRADHRTDDNVKRHIPFSDLYMWLTSAEIDDMGESYYLYHIRERYFEYMDFFCENCKSDETFQPEQCAACQVFAFKERLRSLDPDELKKFAHQTTPHAPVKINLDNCHKFLQWNDIEIPFCSGLQEIPLRPRDLSNASTVKYLGSDNREYMLTTIAVPKSRANNHKIKVLCTEIWKNTEKQGLACNRLISDGVDVRSLRSGAIVIGPNAMFADEANISEQEQIKILDVDKFISDNKEKEHGQT